MKDIIAQSIKNYATHNDLGCGKKGRKIYYKWNATLYIIESTGHILKIAINKNFFEPDEIVRLNWGKILRIVSLGVNKPLIAREIDV